MARPGFESQPRRAVGSACAISVPVVGPRAPHASSEPTGKTNLALGSKKRERRMTYLHGFVAAVPTANREAYLSHAEAAAVVFKEYGALRAVHCWGEDVPDVKVTSFPMAVKCKDNETVVFAWILWPSRAVRDEAM